MTAAAMLAAPALAATPPAFPNNIVIFPERDFVVLEGYEGRAGQTATITVTRNGVETGKAQGFVGAGDPSLEVNHPGGVCWGTGQGAPQVTPNIKAGDVVWVSFSGGGSDSAVTQSPAVTGFTHTPGSTRVVVNRSLTATGGPAAITAQMEQRIVNPDLTPTDVGRRDVRAPGRPGPYVSTLAFTGDTFTATYDFDLASTADIAAEGQMRVLTWMDQDLDANRQGLTISEFGELGGPGMGGCPNDPEQTAPGAHANVGGTPGNASLTATWDAAATIPDGSPVTGYTIEVQQAGNLNAPIFRRVVGAEARSVLVTELTNGTSYNIEVFARSAAGTGPVAVGGPVTPAEQPAPVAPVAPATPTGLVAAAGVRSASVSWDASAGATGYDLQVFRGTSTTALRTLAVTGTSTSVTALRNNTTYRFAVRAKNTVGTATAASTYSARGAAITTPALPGAPVIGAASSGVAGAPITATARWAPPTSDGRSAITGYVVRAQRFASATATRVLQTKSVKQPATSRQLVVTLPQTGIWRFQVQAVNAVGRGTFSARSGAVTAR